MTYSLIFSIQAEDDIVKSINWYNDQKDDLGFEFYEQVKVKLDLLAKSPLHCPVRFKKIRDLLINRFPYLIYYKIIEAQSAIQIIGALHTSRKPQEIKKRK